MLYQSHQWSLINCVNIYCPSCISFKVRIQVFPSCSGMKVLVFLTSVAPKENDSKLFYSFLRSYLYVILKNAIDYLTVKKENCEKGWPSFTSWKRKAEVHSRMGLGGVFILLSIECRPSFEKSAQTSSSCGDKTTWW